MALWDSIPVKNFIFPALHIKIGLGKYVLSNILGFVSYDMDRLFTGEEVACKTLMTLNQVIEKI